MKSTFRLVLRSGEKAGQVFPLEKAEIIIGRDAGNDVAIIDPEISRKHSRLTLQGSNYVLEDLGSTNGTFVNGVRLMGPYILRAGEMITLGEKTNLLFEVSQVDPDATVVSGVAPSPNQTVRQDTPPAMQFPPAAPEPQVQVDLGFVPIQTPPPPPIPQAVSQMGNFAGQIPSNPSFDIPTPPPPEKKKGFPVVLIIILVIFLCLIIGCVIGLVVIDSQNMWCDVLGGIFNAVQPGSCP